MSCQSPGLSGVKRIVLRGGSFGKFLGTIGRTADDSGQQRMYFECKAEYFQENGIWTSTPASQEMWEPQTPMVIQASRLELIGS